MKTMKPLTYAQRRIGVSKNKFKSMLDADPSLRSLVMHLGDEKCHPRIEVEGFEDWIEAQKQKSFQAFRATICEAGVYQVPEDYQLKNAEMDLRYIIANGEEPRNAHWRNAAKLHGGIPDDIAAALGLGKGAPWSLAVERADRILNDKTSAEAKRCAERLAAFSNEVL